MTTKLSVNERAKDHDPELEALVQEALALRLTLGEIAEAALVSDTVLWRWRTAVRPAWDRREQALAGIERLIEDTRRDYINTP